MVQVTDGNLNRVFLVTGPRGQVCVKQSLPYVRVVPTWALFLERLKFEVRRGRPKLPMLRTCQPSLCVFVCVCTVRHDCPQHAYLVSAQQVAPLRVPRVLHFDEAKVRVIIVHLPTDRYLVLLCLSEFIQRCVSFHACVLGVRAVCAVCMCV